MYFLYSWHYSAYILFHHFQSASSEDIFSFGEALPPDWNQLDDVYTLQYSKTNLGPVFMFKALKLGDKLVIYLMVRFSLAIEYYIFIWSSLHHYECESLHLLNK